MIAVSRDAGLDQWLFTGYRHGNVHWDTEPLLYRHAFCSGHRVSRLESVQSISYSTHAHAVSIILLLKFHFRSALTSLLGLLTSQVLSHCLFLIVLKSVLLYIITETSKRITMFSRRIRNCFIKFSAVFGYNIKYRISECIKKERGVDFLDV